MFGVFLFVSFFRMGQIGNELFGEHADERQERRCGGDEAGPYPAACVLCCVRSAVLSEMEEGSERGGGSDSPSTVSRPTQTPQHPHLPGSEGRSHDLVL